MSIAPQGTLLRFGVVRVDEPDGSRMWRANRHVGRFQIGFRLHCHRYSIASDRWVFHPSFAYDRKAVTA